MISKLIRSLRTDGVAGTIETIAGHTRKAARRAHVTNHLIAPLAMLRNPRHASAWFHDRFSSDGPAAQGLPWIAWPCIDFMDRWLQPDHRVFEWGGGGSTVFFLRKGCRVTTVESSSEWVDQLERQIAGLGRDARARWDLRYVPIVDNDDPAVERYIAQVDDGGPWDLVMVDGWSRVKCLLHGMHHVKQGGALVLDNADQKQFKTVPGVMENWRRHPFKGLGVARSWVTETDVYLRLAGDRVAARAGR